MREPDGLAISSRNAHLSAEERASAPVLARSLRAMRQSIREGESSAALLRDQARAMLDREPLVRLDYFEIVDPVSLEPVERVAGPVRLALAAFVGKTRLIDNVLAMPS